jgi:hypothetical protein
MGGIASGGGGGGASFTVGDHKHGYQAADHSGWVLLNGRAKTTLTATQQTAATGLGIGVNLPNAADRGIVGVSGTKALGTIGGASTVTLAQNQLPNINLSHNHGVGVGVGGSSDVFLNGSSGNPRGAVTDAANVYLNGNVTQQPISVQDPYLALNSFIYLGA